MCKDEIQVVEPTLSKESLSYINNCSGGSVNKKDVEEYISHAIGADGDRETFASFIAIVDRFPRDDKRFKRMSKLHIEAKKLNEKYNSFFEEAVAFGTELSKLIKQRVEWSKQNKS